MVCPHGVSSEIRQKCDDFLKIFLNIPAALNCGCWGWCGLCDTVYFLTLGGCIHTVRVYSVTVVFPASCWHNGPHSHEGDPTLLDSNARTDGWKVFPPRPSFYNWLQGRQHQIQRNNVQDGSKVLNCSNIRSFPAFAVKSMPFVCFHVGVLRPLIVYLLNALFLGCGRLGGNIP